MRADRMPDLEVIRVAITQMRPRMPALLGRDWRTFERQINGLIVQATSANLEARRRLIARLMRLLLASAVSDLFRTTLKHAESAAARRRLRKRSAVAHRGFTKLDALGISRKLTKSQKASILALQRERLSILTKAKKLQHPKVGWAAPVRLRKSGAVAHRGSIKPDLGSSKELREFQKALLHAWPRDPLPTLVKAKKLQRPKKAGWAAHKRMKHTQRPVARRARSGGPRPRVVNLVFTHSKGQAVTSNRPLIAKRKYHLRMNIATLEGDSVVRNATRNPIRSDLLPPTTDGYWLKVAAVSNHFEVSKTARWLFLPTSGPSWCCACTPGTTHRCRPSARKPYLLIPMKAPANPQTAEIRLTLYLRISVIQSLLVTVTIVEKPGQRGSNHAVVDYNLTNKLTDLETVQPRALSVMMNDGGDGTHRLVFNGAPDNPVILTLTDDQMTAALSMMRAVLRDVHIEKINNAVTNRYDNNNSKSLPDFVSDLREAAARGWQLWVSIWGDRIEEWTTNESKFVGDSNVIQISRKKNSTAVFPWAMVYSIPVDTGSPTNNRLCQLLDKMEWARFRAEPNVPLRCPFEASHDQDIVCPYGFWGFRYQIEQPPSLVVGRERNPNIRSDPRPLHFVAALSQALDRPLLKKHLDALTAQHKHFTIQDCNSRDAIRDALGARDLELAYFYCHGLKDPLPGGIGSATNLGVGKDEVITPPDLVRWRVKSWPKDHWATVAPLVFINGCHTADMTSQTLVSFVDAFSASLRAAGVIGTEITLHQLVANEVAETFLDAFQRGNNVGAALRTARAALLCKGNLLGLAYTAYCSADLKFKASVV